MDRKKQDGVFQFHSGLANSCSGRIWIRVHGFGSRPIAIPTHNNYENQLNSLNERIRIEKTELSYFSEFQ